MHKPKNFGDVYVADQIQIKSAKGVFTGHYSDLKKQFNLTDERLYIALKDQFDKGNIQVQFKAKEA